MVVVVEKKLFIFLPNEEVPSDLERDLTAHGGSRTEMGNQKMQSFGRGREGGRHKRDGKVCLVFYFFL